MDEIIFNFHDVILIMTSILCLSFAVLLVIINTEKKACNYFLSAFLLAHAFIPINELILWGAAVKWKVREAFPELTFLGGFAYYVDGALLYFYIKSLIHKNFSLKTLDLMHCIPLLLYAFYMFFSIYNKSPIDRINFITSENLVYGKSYVALDFFCRCLRVTYCLFCLSFITKYKDALKKSYADVDKTDITWLKLLVVGFLLVMSMEAILGASKVVSLMVVFDANIFIHIGLTGYYVLFLLVNILVFSSIKYFPIMKPVNQKQPERRIIQGPA